jgi:hypothetical protein
MYYFCWATGFYVHILHQQYENTNMSKLYSIRNHHLYFAVTQAGFTSKFTICKTRRKSSHGVLGAASRDWGGTVLRKFP